MRARRRAQDPGPADVILAVTLNLALDVTYRVDARGVGTANRVQRVSARAGGKGVNAARVLTRSATRRW